MKFCHLWKMNGTGDHHVEQDKPSSERQISCFSSYAQSRHNIYKTLLQNWDWGEPVRGGGGERSVIGGGKYDLSTLHI
jgi:hypothetical protein